MCPLTHRRYPRPLTQMMPSVEHTVLRRLGVSPPTWKTGTRRGRRAGNIKVTDPTRQALAFLSPHLDSVLEPCPNQRWPPFSALSLQLFIRGMGWKFQEPKRQQPSSYSKVIFFFNFIYLFLAALGLRRCARAFSSCGEQGLLFAAVRRLLTAVASLVAEHGLQARGLQQLWHTGSVVVARGLQSTGSVVVVHRLSCSMACGIFPDQGLNPCPLHWQADS